MGLRVVLVEKRGARRWRAHLSPARRSGVSGRRHAVTKFSCLGSVLTASERRDGAPPSAREAMTTGSLYSLYVRRGEHTAAACRPLDSSFRLLCLHSLAAGESRRKARLAVYTRQPPLLGIGRLFFKGRGGGRVRSPPGGPRQARTPRSAPAAGITTHHAIAETTKINRQILRTPRPRSRRSGACSPRRSRCSAALVDASSSV